MEAYDDLITAMAVVQDRYTAICEELGDDKMPDRLARAILMQLRPIARHVSGQNFDHYIQGLSGVASVEALGDHYPELLA